MGKHIITAVVKDKRGRIISVGRNSYVKTHPLMHLAAKATNSEPSRVYLHAEVAALVKLKDWSRAYRMEVFRYTKNGEQALAKPCKSCQHVINQTKIRQVFYTE
jgi:deoxycytidylate deaminase